MLWVLRQLNKLIKDLVKKRCMLFMLTVPNLVNHLHTILYKLTSIFSKRHLRCVSVNLLKYLIFV